MKNFKELVKVVDELGKKGIWAYMLEIITVIDGRDDLSAAQKQEAYNLASVEFENAEDGSIGANVYADAAVQTILDEEYDGDDADNVHDLFNEKLDGILG